jgi:hypothetical protein
LASLHAGNLNNTIYLHFSTISRVNEGFYFLVLKNRSDFDDFCFHILFEIRNILVGAHKYCLNNNFAIYTNIKMRYNENREIRGGMIQSNFSNSNLQGERIFVRVKEISSYRN